MISIPTVSVVIPHYNSPITLDRALRSVASQTVKVHEVIVVDDATPDLPAREHARTLCKEHGATFLSLESNVGPGRARNEGWDHAEGEWVAFLDADDAWHPRKIERQAPFLRQGVSLVGTLSGVFDPDLPEPWDDLDGEPKARRVLMSHLVRGNPFSTSSVVLRADADFRFDPEKRYCEDYEVWSHAVASGPAWSVPEELCVRYKEPFGQGGLSGRMVRMARGEFQVLSSLGRDGTFTLPQTLAAKTFLLVRITRRFALAGIRKVRGKL